MSVAYEAEIDDAEAEAEERPAFNLTAAMASPNIAFDLDEQTLAEIGRKVVEEFEIDEASLKDNGWTGRCESALKLAMLAKDEKTYPFPGASNVKFPLLATAAIQFNARAYPASVDGYNVVKAKTLGKPDDVKRARAERIGRHMSWQLLEEMEDWEEDTDQLLLVLPIVGCVVRKTYFDPIKGRNCSHLIMPDKFVVNYWAKRDLNICPRATHICDFYPHEITEKFNSGLWLKQELGRSEGEDDDAPHEFLEQYRLWDLDGDGYPEPYIVTVHRETARVVRIYARFSERGLKVSEAGDVICIEPEQYFTKYGFLPAPDGSFYDVGFGTLLEPQNETINSLINQLMDAGHLANVQGGFIGNGVSIKSGNLRFKPGEWKKVDVAGQNLKDSIVPLPVKEPSAVLFNLLGMLIESTKVVTATKDILTGEQPANTPVGTTLALIEQGLKVFTAIYKRIHRSLKRELRLLYRLNSQYLEPEVYFTFQDDEQAVAQQDYAQGDVDVLPVSDSSVVTDMQRMARAQFLQTMRADPLMNGKEINRRVLEAASIPDTAALFAQDQGPPPELLAKMAELENKKRELDLKEADTRARNAKLYADMLSVLANLGRQQQKGPDGTTSTVVTPINPAVGGLMDDLRQMAEEEINGQVQPADVPGMAGPSPDGGLPPIPEGPAGGPGGFMGAGEPDGAGGPIGGVPPGQDGGAGLV